MISSCCPFSWYWNEKSEKSGQLTDETKIRKLTDEEIKKTIEDFPYATKISIKAGYDGIEIHRGNNYPLY